MVELHAVEVVSLPPADDAQRALTAPRAPALPPTHAADHEAAGAKGAPAAKQPQRPAPLPTVFDVSPLAQVVSFRRGADKEPLARVSEALGLAPAHQATLHLLALLLRCRQVEATATPYLADPGAAHVTVRDLIDLADVIGDPCPRDALLELEAASLVLVDRRDPTRRHADRPVSLPEVTAALLTSRGSARAALPPCATLHPTTGPTGNPRGARLGAAARALADGPATVVALTGPGAQALACEIAAGAGAPLLVVDASALPPRADEAGVLLTALLLVARVEGWVPCFTNVDETTHGVSWTAPLALARGLVLALSSRPSALPTSLRAALADVVAAPATVGMDAPARLATASGLAPGSAAALDARDRLATTSDDAAARLESPRATLDDLVLDAVTRDALREVADACSVHGLLLDTWGFREVRPTGNGVGVLLDGPPGTGKTMAAHAVAALAGKALLRVDVPSVLSRWIGETEQRLAAVFERARELGAVLLFDEADSLFARRSQDVRSSSDRFANVGVNTVLQLLERHDGIVVLTTNLTEALDPAVRRRLRYRVTFERPGVDERTRLWERNLPWQAPLADDIDLGALAASYELTGAHVANAALRAAARAAAQGTPISQIHLQDAARAECRALGMLCRDV